MKSVKWLFLACAVLAGLQLTACSQKSDDVRAREDQLENFDKAGDRGDAGMIDDSMKPNPDEKTLPGDPGVMQDTPAESAESTTTTVPGMIPETAADDNLSTPSGNQLY